MGAVGARHRVVPVVTAIGHGLQDSDGSYLQPQDILPAHMSVVTSDDHDALSGYTLRGKQGDTAAAESALPQSRDRIARTR